MNGLKFARPAAPVYAGLTPVAVWLADVGKEALGRTDQVDDVANAPLLLVV